MNNKNVEQEILKILSESVLKGSNRELALDKPIGEAGLGLDSMSRSELVCL